MDGNTAEGIYRQLTDPSDAHYIPAEILAKANVITITCGGNDMMDFMYGVMLKAYNDANPETPITSVDELKTTIQTDKVKALKLVVAAKKAVTAELVESAGFQNAAATFEAELNKLVGYIRSKNPSATLILATQYHPYQAFAVENLSTTQKIFVNFIHTAISPCLVLEPEEKSVCTHINVKYSCGCGANCSDVSTCANQQAEYSYQHASNCSNSAPLKTLNSVIADNAVSLGYTVSDVYSAFVNSPSKGKDYCNASISGVSSVELDFHPNAAGHEVIAQTVLATVKSVNDNLALTPAIKSANLAKGTVTIEGTGLYTRAFAAFYDSNNRMVGIAAQVLDPTQTQASLTAKLNGTATDVKVFLLSRNDLTPDCASLVWGAN